MNTIHFKINFQAIHLKNITYTIATFCMLVLMTVTGYAQLTSTDGYVHLRDQSLYGNDASTLYYNSNHSTVTQLVMRDKDEDMHGKLYGHDNAVGQYFGLKDADNDWSYVTKKDDYTHFRIDNVTIMKLFADGKVGIGTTTVPSDYLLAVDGRIIATEMRVKPSNFWDEVFEQDYDLMSIEEKQKFTEINKHLPSFAPESEIVDEGMDVGKSFADVAKELEEAYLYIYQLNDEVKELKSQLSDKDKLQKQLDELKAQLAKLSEQSND